MNTEDLPSDFKMTQLQDALTDLKEDSKDIEQEMCVFCTYENKSVVAVRCCWDCGKSFCLLCAEKHDQVAHYHEHYVVDVGNADLVRCKQHTAEYVTHYSSHGDEYVCDVCIVNSYSNDKLTNLKRIAPLEEKNMKPSFQNNFKLRQDCNIVSTFIHKYI